MRQKPVHQRRCRSLKAAASVCQPRCRSLKAVYHCHFQTLSPQQKIDPAISKIARSGFRYEPIITFSLQAPQQLHMLVSIKFRVKCVGFIRSVPLHPQREWFLSHSLQDRLPGTGMHLPPPAARPYGQAESEHIRVSPFPPEGWQPYPFW